VAFTRSPRFLGDLDLAAMPADPDSSIWLDIAQDGVAPTCSIPCTPSRRSWGGDDNSAPISSAKRRCIAAVQNRASASGNTAAQVSRSFHLRSSGDPSERRVSGDFLFSD
jgi:hypothetical protein